MLYLLRHGETVWNAAGRYQGALDSPLTTRGEHQADNLGKLLALLTTSHVGKLRAYVSPLGRAQATAAIIARSLPLDIRLESRVAEVGLGSWDGLTDYEIEMEHPGRLAGANAFDWYFRAPGGETLQAAQGRVSGWLQECERPALVVSHALTGRIVRGMHLGLDAQAMLRQPDAAEGLYVLTPGRADFIPTDFAAPG